MGDRMDRMDISPEPRQPLNMAQMIRKSPSDAKPSDATNPRIICEALLYDLCKRKDFSHKSLFDNTRVFDTFVHSDAFIDYITRCEILFDGTHYTYGESIMDKVTPIMNARQKKYNRCLDMVDYNNIYATLRNHYNLYGVVLDCELLYDAYKI